MDPQQRFRGVASRLVEHAVNRGEKCAVVREKLTIDYRQLLGLALYVTQTLRLRGVGGQTVVGLTVKDELTHLVVSLSLLMLGATQITLASHDPQEARIALGRRAGVELIIGDHESFRLDGLSYLAIGSFETLSEGSEASQPISFAESGTGRLLLQTSGTTDICNIVPIDEHMLLVQAGIDNLAEDRQLRLATVEHNNSKRHRLYSLLSGGTVILYSGGGTDLLDFCARHRVSRLELSRLHAFNLLSSARSNQRRLPESTKLIIAGSTVPITLRDALQKHVTKKLFVRYASTESGVISLAGPGQHDHESAGIPADPVCVQVVDEQRNPLSPMTVGSIRVKVPGMASAYFDNPEQSRKRFQDGWFYPGDMGELLVNGELLVHGRSDDMIILNGINIFPSHLEAVLNRHPAVRESVVVGLNSLVHGQIPVAAVEIEKGTRVTEKELKQYAARELALRAPRKVLIVEKLPRNAQDKIERRKVVKLFQDEASTPE